MIVAGWCLAASGAVSQWPRLVASVVLEAVMSMDCSSCLLASAQRARRGQAVVGNSGVALPYGAGGLFCPGGPGRAAHLSDPDLAPLDLARMRPCRAVEGVSVVGFRRVTAVGALGPPRMCWLERFGAVRETVLGRTVLGLVASGGSPAPCLSLGVVHLEWAAQGEAGAGRGEL
jgi:hypothetical protein